MEALPCVPPGFFIHMLWILGHYELPLLLEYVTSPEQCVVVGKQNPLNESVDHLIQGL